MNDLAEVVLARIAEDESVARSVQDVPPTSDSDVFTALSAPTGTVEMAPRRVLAECEAKRRLVREPVDYMEGDYAPWNERFLKLLALLFADHPDYRQEWKP